MWLYILILRLKILSWYNSCIMDQTQDQDSCWILTKFFFMFSWTKKVEVYKNPKNNEADIQPSWPNKLGH